MTVQYELTITHPSGRTTKDTFEDVENAKDRAQELCNKGCYVSLRRLQIELLGQYFPKEEGRAYTVHKRA